MGINIVTLLMVIVVSAFGGFVHWIRKPNNMHNITDLTKTVSTGVFTGVLIFIALKTTNIDIAFQYALAGLASYIGGSLLDLSATIAEGIIEKKLGVNPEHIIEDLADKSVAVSTSNSEEAVSATPVLETEQEEDDVMGLNEEEKPVSMPPTNVKTGEIDLKSFAQSLESSFSGSSVESTAEEAPVKPKRKRAPRKKKLEATAPAGSTIDNV